MDRFLQVSAGALVAAVLGLVLNKQGKDISVLLTVAVLCMVLGAVAAFLDPVMDFVRRLQALGQLNSQMIQILLKSVGIGLIGEMAALICQDCGNTALGKAVQILTGATVLWLSIPMMQGLLDTVQRIVGEI